MKNYIVHNEWSIIEDGYKASNNLVSESLMSLGNGFMGLRGNFEETFTGNTLQGSYVGGVYYPDKTRVGWWKNGYPEYFAKVLNNVNWIGLQIKINDETLDLNKAEIKDFRRELNMQKGLLLRNFTAVLKSGIEVKVQTTRFVSMHQTEVGALQYKVTLSHDAKLEVVSFLDFDIENQDSNYEEKFWEEADRAYKGNEFGIVGKTKKSGFLVAATCCTSIKNGEVVLREALHDLNSEKYIGKLYSTQAKAGVTVEITKICSILSSLNHSADSILGNAFNVLSQAKEAGYKQLQAAHENVWLEKWNECDIKIEGDVAAQQGIRFNIFQLYQTYTGDDERLNIGPKGFTGEKYGGSTYWDTEAYCLPFYLATASPKIAKQLLIYRYRHLPKAIENAQKLGFTCGAALYPMVTINGEECHNEWEITFEEIHRNGAIAHAIFNYVNYTNDKAYLAEYGVEVLIGIARFWAQRVNWSSNHGKYVMLGVTGPNEFENNVNNNWYTNYLSNWCLRYAAESLEYIKENHKEDYERIIAKTEFAQAETTKWKHIVDNMYYPLHPEIEGVMLQQDGFLDKELIPVSELPASQRPIVEHWSWDRILRSVYIKQGDVLQGLYFLEHEFNTETIRKNFDFYEPFTVHESSLSPCIHAVLAAKIGNEEKAYEYYLRTARLDLDDYNNDTKDGCHITSMAGSWLAVVQGFAGMRVQNGAVVFNPFIPQKWNSYTFRISFRGALLSITVNQQKVSISNLSTEPCHLNVYGNNQILAGNETIEQKLQHAMA